MNLRNPRTKALIFTGLGVLLAISIFYYLFQHITWQQVIDLIRHMSLPLLAIFFVLSVSMQVTRTLRYRLILRSAGEHPGFFRLFLAVLVRGFCVDLLPARTGELVYIYILRTKLGVNLGAATASFALSFLFDIMALAPLLIVALSTILLGPTTAVFSYVLLTAGIALFILSATLIHFLPLALRVAFWICTRTFQGSHRFGKWLLRLLASTHRQVRRARRAGIYNLVFSLSILVRLFKYCGLYVLLLAMLFPQGYALAELPFQRVFLGFTAAEMAASLPISGIAGFGAYQGAWTLAFVLLGFPAELAKTTSVSHHLFTQVYGYLIGLFSLLALLSLRTALRTNDKKIRRPTGV